MAAAFGWGILTASSLVIGALVALRFRIGLRVIGLILAFGAGVLISAVAFDLVEEAIDNDTPVYAVRCGGKEHAIYGPSLDEEGGGSWGRATVAFFSIVNEQLASTAHRFYAINAGNDLGGMFLTAAEAEGAIGSLRRKTDWPYIPQNEHPWYGQDHDEE